MLTGAWAPCAGQAIGSADTAQLDAAFRTCVSLYEHPLAGALMRAIGDNAVRDAFVAAHPAVGGLSIERSKGYSIATAPLKDFSVAGVAARAIYASTCQLECELAMWGLQFGPLKAGQVKALQAWVESAPATPTGHATPYHPGTKSRTGKPWLGSNSSPFIRKASNVSGSQALAKGKLRAKFIGSG